MPCSDRSSIRKRVQSIIITQQLIHLLDLNYRIQLHKTSTPDARMLFAPLSLLLCLAGVSTTASALAEPRSHLDDGNKYDESLVFRPLADGKLSVLFRFHTRARNGKPL